MELKNLHQKLFFYLLDYTSLLFLVIINFFSLALLFFVSPLLGVVWLLLLTLFFFIKGEYKNIFISWGIFFSFWYSLFIFCLLDFESPIWIGGSHTQEILTYFSYKYSESTSLWYTDLFKSFCVQTVFYIHLLSVQLGFPIYIPSIIQIFAWPFKIFKVVRALFKILLGKLGNKDPVNCAGEEDFKKGAGPKDSLNPLGGLFKKSPKNQDLNACGKFREDLKKNQGFFSFFHLYGEQSGVVGDKVVTYKELTIPFINHYTACMSRRATYEELKEHKNKNP